ncbi:vWA domain-containing protein [Streptomyces sp. NPDC001985]|uniref:vWA domain-containing protein n=1 Tax=Streptomyces sp. NPDC001985 TaxID=3154406 RepID=UPI0033212795
MHRRTRTHRRAGKHRGVVAALLAGGLLLTAGCSSGGQSDRGSAQPAAERKGAGSGSGSGSGSGAGPGGGGSAVQAPAPDQDHELSREDGYAKRKAPDYLSTFALDVDTASYAYARRTLQDGRRPDPAGIRPEEFVNSFRQDYPRPEGDGFSVTVDGAALRGTEGELRGGTGGEEESGEWSLVRVGLATRPGAAGTRPPAALTFVIDVSGSMAEPGRLDLVRTSLGVLTDELRDDDSIAVVTFSGRAETRLPMTRLDGNRDRVHRVIEALEPADSTHVEAGVRTGYETAVDGHRRGATNRVVLLSDALANTGETRADAILEQIGDARREYGITLFGVGVGSDYGDALMERLADKGDGHTTYVSTEEEAERVFRDQLPVHVELRARDVKAQVAFEQETVERFRLIGYENREVADEDFRDDRVDGGEVGPGHTVTALYAVRLRPGASGRIAEATVRWLDPETRAPREESGVIGTSGVRKALWGGASARFQVAAVAAYFAGSLRDERIPGAPSLGELGERARALAESTEDSAVRELAETIDRAHRPSAY